MAQEQRAAEAVEDLRVEVKKSGDEK